MTVIGEQSVVSEAELETVVPTSLRESREQRGGDEASTPSDVPQRPARTRPGSSPDGLLPRPALAPLSCAKSAPSPSHRMRVRVPSGQTAEPLSLRLLAVGPDRCARRPGASAALLQALPFIFRVPRGAPSPRSRRLALSRKDSRETSAGLSCCLVPSDPALPWGIRPCVGGCGVGQPSSSSRPDTAHRLPRGGKWRVLGSCPAFSLPRKTCDALRIPTDLSLLPTGEDHSPTCPWHDHEGPFHRKSSSGPSFSQRESHSLLTTPAMGASSLFSRGCPWQPAPTSGSDFCFLKE